MRCMICKRERPPGSCMVAPIAYNILDDDGLEVVPVEGKRIPQDMLTCSHECLLVFITQSREQHAEDSTRSN